MREKRVSEAVIRRLPRYYRELSEIKRRGISRISSAELAEEMNLNASQIRQDFNCFGGFGQQGYGYHVQTLLEEIRNILGLTKRWSAVLIGVGNIGSALLRYKGFSDEGMEIVAAFDVSEELIGQTIGSVEIRNAADLSTYLSSHEIQIGVICTQKEPAQSVCDVLVRGGVEGIWNYAPVDVNSEKAFVENVHLNDSMFVLSYRLNNHDE